MQGFEQFSQTSLEEATSVSHRIPPHSVEAEQALLGALLINDQLWEKVADIIHENDFYRPEHSIIFKGIKQLQENAEPCDVLILRDLLESQGTLGKVDGLGYLDQLTRSVPVAMNVSSYAKIIQEGAIRRQLIQAGQEIIDSVYEAQGSTKEILDQAESKVFTIAEKKFKNNKGFICVKDLLSPALDKIDLLYQRQTSITGVPSGFTDLDQLTSGFQASDLVIIAGRPSMGKTAFAMNIAEYVAVHEKLPVAVFSMEMPVDQLVTRLIASVGGINQQHLRTGQLEDDDWVRITSSITILNDANLFIDDTAALTPIELRARARRLAKEHGPLGLIVIDYLQLMQGSGEKRENRTTEVAEISRSLKALAKELEVPVIALSQLNRSVEQRGDKRPMMSDLRESGAIEQDADMILFIYRDEVYNPNTEHQGVAEIVIGKQRNGPIGTVNLTFLKDSTRFSNYTEDPLGRGY